MAIYFDPSFNRSGCRFQRIVSLILLLGGATFAASCAGTSHSDYALAPPPPAVDLASLDNDYVPLNINQLATIETAAGVAALDSPAALALDAKANKPKCRPQDRFDRTQVLAYQWGKTGESRVGFDIDGLGFDGGKVEAMKVEYSIRLQPHKTKAEKCRYESRWQGLVGSGYHELFLREEDTVWQDLNEFQADVDSRLDTLFGD